MANFLSQLEHIITVVSDTIWPIFLPFILVVGAITSIRTIFIVQKQATKPSTLKLKNAIGPAAISLGAMIGTGAVVGVMGALSKLYAAGQHNIEALAIWALIGALIMVPVSYSETLNSKIMGKTPKEYISYLIGPKLGMVYAVCFVALSVFGFGGFQFSGIDSVSAIVASKFMGIETTFMQRYLFIVVPVIIIVALLVLSKRHEVFMDAMTYMIGTAVAAYFIFFTIFVIKTASYIPTYLHGMIQGMMNPVNAMLGVPLGFILGMQKIIQTAETGLGALAMAAQESDSEPREAAMIALIPTIVTVFVSIVVTSYIASYGVRNGIIHFPADTITRLTQLFETAQDVTGVFGLIVFSLFTVLSALTTILGSYYYMTKLFKSNHINTNIAIYLVLVFTAGTLAVFGANVVFEAVDLLMFVLCGINVTTLMIFTFKAWKKYKLDDNDLDQSKRVS
ncbi:alanine:cation symporter family protein [uncultured Intestinibacter sp.]|uniref:alanine:cation symporter family protein n=1 Tax=uncultured Intestinibacter sp. TaxID=1505659 RepID=UPI0027DC637E|nr:alanine:cation symporter family protein [uncultured Intestinibacter sp.]